MKRNTAPKKSAAGNVGKPAAPAKVKPAAESRAAKAQDAPTAHSYTAETNASACSSAQPQLSSASVYPEHTDVSGSGQKFIKNSRYFTICIYAAVMLVLSAVIFKAILDFDKTKAWFGQIFGMLSPFIFGALLAYVLNPMVHMFYRLITKLSSKTGLKIKHSIHTVLAILITYMIVIGAVVVILRYVLPEITKNLMDFANYVPQAYASLLDFFSYLQERFPQIDIAALTKPVTDAMPDLITTVRDMATNMVPAIYSLSMSIASWIINLLITIIVSVYMLYDKRRLMHSSWRIIYAFLPKRHIPACQEILTECNRLFSSFVVGKFIDSTIIGLLCVILMTILHLDYVPLISIIVGVTNMIPYFGPFIGAVPGILILLFISPVKSLIFAVMILGLQQFDGLILGPKILGDSTGMKPLWIIFAITVGGNIAGVIGMFLGVPAVAIISYLFDRYLSYRLEKKEVSESLVESALKNLELDD